MYKKPWIVCPIVVSIYLPADKSKIALGNQWRLPNNNMEQLSVHPSEYNSTYEFPAGKTIVTWTATNLEGSVKSCNYHIYVKGELWLVLQGLQWCLNSLKVLKFERTSLRSLKSL